ncbi:MAG: cytochrome P450 [Acidimicrobiales bacterium]
MSELLGVSEQLGDDLRQRAAQVAGIFAPPGSDQAGAAETSLGGWVADALDAEDTHAGGGLLSSLLSGCGSPGAAASGTDEVRNVVLTLLLGGPIPPARALAHGLLRLLRRPDLVARLRAHPDLTPTVVEESLRLDHAVASSGLRLATEDLQIGSVAVSAGEVVVVSLGAVNRDPSRFPHPHELALDRAHHSHLSFAAGPHRCLGASIARAQLAAALHAVLAQADPRLAVDDDQLRWQPGYFTDLPSVPGLPLDWHPHRSLLGIPGWHERSFGSGEPTVMPQAVRLAGRSSKTSVSS